MLERPWGAPIISKDGVTVAKEIDLEDPAANIGAQMVKEVASKTSEAAGDGTTATILAESIYARGSKMVAVGHDPMDIKRGIDRATQVVVDHLAETSHKVGSSAEIAQVGTISANGDRATRMARASQPEWVRREVNEGREPQC